MARQFLTRNSDDEDDHIMEAIASREAELACYDCNVEIYEAQLATMADVPEQIPEKIAALKGKTNEQIIALGATNEDAAEASRFNHRNRVKMLHFTEQAERAKSELAYQALLAKLPAGPKRDAALARHVAKTAAQKAK